ncbi:MAG TPA: hypothetical protein VFQ35_02280, partial [Polyangiaceae bacterium]|nr:hypothetical protein [Polyangiaceae bacterium]
MIESGTAQGIDPIETRLTLAELDQLVLARLAAATSMPEAYAALREGAVHAARELHGVDVSGAAELRTAYRALAATLERVQR